MSYNSPKYEVYFFWPKTETLHFFRSAFVNSHHKGKKLFQKFIEKKFQKPLFRIDKIEVVTPFRQTDQQMNRQTV
jgi:hypothetical protein